MTRASQIIAFVLCSVVATAALSSRADAGMSESQRLSILEEGQASFEKGTSLLNSDPAAAQDAFKHAATRWNTIIDDGVVNGPLLYDLGNAWVQAGNLGKGIAAYLRSERYMPGDPRLAENLAYARSLVSPQFSSDSTSAMLQRWTDWLSGWSAWTRTIVFAAAWLTFWCLLLWRRKMAPPPWRWLAGGSLAVSLVAGAAAIFAVLGTGGPTGVLIEDEVIVRKGDAESYSPRFDEPIHRGVEFRILEERPIWLHVEFPNGDDGWVPRDAAEVVLRPSSRTSQA